MLTSLYDAYVCTYVRTKYVRMSKCTYVHTYIRTHNTHPHTPPHKHICMYVRTYVCKQMYTRKLACRHVGMHACMQTCQHACMHAHKDNRFKSTASMHEKYTCAHKSRVPFSCDKVGRVGYSASLPQTYVVLTQNHNTHIHQMPPPPPPPTHTILFRCKLSWDFIFTNSVKEDAFVTLWWDTQSIYNTVATGPLVKTKFQTTNKFHDSQNTHTPCKH